MNYILNLIRVIDLHDPSLYSHQVFASGKVLYAGQGIGLVIAESYDVASQASKMVKVEYANVQKPILTIKDALDNGNVQPDYNLITGKREPVIVGDVEGMKSSYWTLRSIIFICYYIVIYISISILLFEFTYLWMFFGFGLFLLLGVIGKDGTSSCLPPSCS